MTQSSPPPAWLAPQGSTWRTHARQRIHDNPWFGVEVDEATAPTGAAATYYVQRYKNLAVGALPLHEDGAVTLVGQWRYPLNEYSWEIPEGGVPEGETALEGARRELAEEAGLTAEHWREVLWMDLSNASSDERAVGFLATNLAPAPRAPDETEDLAIVRVPFMEALEQALLGRIRDSITVAMLLRVHHMALKGELEAGLAKAVLGAL